MAALAMLSAAVLLLLFLPSSMANNILYGGETLKTGQFLTEGAYNFTMQPNCNLVLTENGHSVWSTSTGGKGTNCYLAAQTDGNLVVYDKDKNVIWSSGTWSRWGGPYLLVLQRNRNVVWYDSKWSTNTNTANSGGVVIFKIGRNDNIFIPEVVDEATNRKKKIAVVVLADVNNILYGGETLKSGESLTEGTYTFTMQPNCNLVLADGGHAVWSTNTGGKGTGCYFAAQTDGNLVVYDKGKNVIWSSGTWSNRGGPYLLIMQRNRNVVWYDSKWDTNTATASAEGDEVIVKSGRYDARFDEPTNRKIAMVINN